MSTNHQEQGTCRHLSSESSAPWRIHLTPGLGPRLPLTATAAQVTQMEADGLLRVAISAEEAVVWPLGNQGGGTKMKLGQRSCGWEDFWSYLKVPWFSHWSICGSLRDVEVIFRERPDTVFAGNVPGKAWFVRHSHGRILWRCGGVSGVRRCQAAFSIFTEVDSEIGRLWQAPHNQWFHLIWDGWNEVDGKIWKDMERYGKRTYGHYYSHYPSDQWAYLGPVPKDFFERHNDQVIANQFAELWWQL